MDKNALVQKLLKQISSKRAKDYTFASLFFIVFSVFVFFAIRPSLVTAFSLKKEESELNQLNDTYEKIISKIVSIQSSFEEYRDDLHLFSEAIPSKPNVNRLIGDIEQATATSSVAISKINTGEVNLVDRTKGTLRSTTVNIDASADFENLLQSIQEIYGQRRLKKIKRLDISSQTKDSSGSAGLKLKLEVEGYYL